MYQSQSFVYLDLQKTGTNFIVDFLQRFNAEPGPQRFKHRPLRHRFDANKLYFISVRDPLDQYISLFSFGCGGRGAVQGRLQKHHRMDLYERSTKGFQRWLEFVLDPSNAQLVDPRYARCAGGHLPQLLGFQSFRFLYLALPDPKTLAGCQSREDLEQTYRAKTIVKIFVRHSHFVSDLKTLVQDHLHDAVSDVGAALMFLDSAPPLNSSNRIDRHQDFAIDQRVRQMLQEREWLFYDGIVPM